MNIFTKILLVALVLSIIAVGVVWYYFGLDKAVTQAILIPLISYLLLDRGLPKYLELAIAILGFTTSVIGGITLIVINY